MATVPLGQCPECGTEIPTLGLLIKYESADGWPMVLAECPGCHRVVPPTGTSPGAVVEPV